MSAKTDSLISVFVICLWGTMGLGWILNILKLFWDDGPLDPEAILRLVGIFLVPIGAILGYL